MSDGMHCPTILRVQGNSLATLLFGLPVIPCLFHAKGIHPFHKAKARNVVIPARHHSSHAIT
ncbi:hypothetical protein D3C87_1625600 [compost metagenome]